MQNICIELLSQLYESVYHGYSARYPCTALCKAIFRFHYSNTNYASVQYRKGTKREHWMFIPVLGEIRNRMTKIQLWVE